MPEAPLPVYFWVSAKVDGDNVKDALKECREKAKDNLGIPDPILVESHWMPDWIGTLWADSR